MDTSRPSFTITLRDGLSELACIEGDGTRLAVKSETIDMTDSQWHHLISVADQIRALVTEIAHREP